MGLQLGSIPLGRLFGIPIRLHGLLPVVLLFEVLLSFSYGGLWPLYFFLLLGPILLFSVLTLELGHCLAARQVGGHAESILLWPVGGLAYIGHNQGPKADIWVALAGPLTLVPVTIFWVCMLVASTYATYGTTSISLGWPGPLTLHNLGVAICVGAVVFNMSLFAFNLLVPAYPLNGGRILVGSLLLCGVAERTTAVVTCCVATPIAAGVIVWGCIQYQLQPTSTITILVGLWMLWSTYQLFDCYRKGLLAQHPMFAFTAQQNITAGGDQNQSPTPCAQQTAAGSPMDTYQPPAALGVQGCPVQGCPPNWPPARV